MREKPKYELVEYDGKTMRRYENGTIRDEKGIIRYQPSHVARAVQQAQRDIARLAAIEGVNEATGKDDFYESVRELFKVRAQMALTDTTRAGNEALRLIMQGTGLGMDRVTTVQGTIHHVPEPPRPTELFLRLLEERQSATEGEIIEEEE